VAAKKQISARDVIIDAAIKVAHEDMCRQEDMAFLLHIEEELFFGTLEKLIKETESSKRNNK
jgi:hypothetical protein